jgi:hypothetical protein
MAQEPHGPGHGPAARTEQQDHTPRREEQDRRDAQPKREAPKQDKAAADKAAAELKEAQAAASIGAQIILDYNEDGSKGARGGAGGSVEENTLARDAWLTAQGLDPVSPSGPPPTPEALAAKKKREEQAADPAFYPPPSGKAGRISSLAAGIASEDLPDPPAGTVRGGAA